MYESVEGYMDMYFKFSMDMNIIIFLCFYLQKKLDFTLKVVGGELSAVPGISDAIEV